MATFLKLNISNSAHPDLSNSKLIVTSRDKDNLLVGHYVTRDELFESIEKDFNERLKLLEARMTAVVDKLQDEAGQFLDQEKQGDRPIFLFTDVQDILQ